MSVKVMAWVLETVHLPGDPVAKLILLGLAEHANPDGTASWPPQAKLSEYADVSVRTVRTKLRTLENLGLIVSGDQQLVDHLPSNRRPHVWDVDMSWEGTSGRKTASGQKNLPGGSLLPPKTASWAEAGRTLGRKTSSYKPSLEPSIKEPTGSEAPAPPVDNSQKLIAEWIDHCPGGRPPGRVVGQVSKEVGLLLGEGIPYLEVRTGLQQWQAKGLHPSALASVVHEVRTASSRPATNGKRLEPAEDERSKRLRTTPDPIPPADLTPAEQNRWLREARRRIANGERVS